MAKPKKRSRAERVSRSWQRPKQLMGVQQCLLSPNQELRAILEYICTQSNSLHNCAVYYARQIWFKTKRGVSGFDLVNEAGQGNCI